MAVRVEHKRSANAHTRHAPFTLRCGAFLLDYTLIISLLAASALIAQITGGGARLFGSTVETFGYILAIVAALLNFVVAAGLTGSTFGKWATGLRIERPDGESLGLWRAFLRHFIGYPISLLLLGGGFLLALIHPHGRALHDLIARTEVCVAPEYARQLNER